MMFPPGDTSSGPTASEPSPSGPEPLAARVESKSGEALATVAPRMVQEAQMSGR